MEESILFRSMIDSFSNNEFKQFTDGLFSKFNKRKLLTKCIFHLLAYQGRNALKTKYSKNINKILINIIHSRNNKQINHYQDEDEDEDEDEDIDIDKKNKLSINDLSYDLVSNIGSYLSFPMLIKYQLCNRHIYISCKQNISSITELTCMKSQPGHWFTRYITNNFGSKSSRITNLKQFNNARILHLSAHDFDIITNENKNPENFVWKNIKYLSLSNLHNRLHQNPEQYTSWISKYGPILKSQNNLTHLFLVISNTIDLESLYKILTVNDNIKYVRAYSYSHILCIKNDENINELLEKYDFTKIKLKGFAMKDDLNNNDHLFLYKLMTQISKNLETYHIRFGSYRSPNLIQTNSSFWEQHATENEMKLSNLKELVIDLSYPHSNTAPWHESITIFQKVIGSKLERLQIITPGEFADDNDWNRYSQFIHYIMTTQKSIHHLSLICDNGTALRTIMNYLKNNDNGKILKNIKIDFVGWTRRKRDSTTYTILGDYRQIIEDNLFKSIDIINDSMSDYFMIKFDNSWFSQRTRNRDNLDVIGYNRFKEKVDKLKRDYDIDITRERRRGTTKNKTCYVVTTKDVEINGGYHTDWIMPSVQLM